MLPSDITFRANPDERRTGPREPSSLLGSRLYIAFFGACLFHAGVLLFLLYVNWEPVIEPPPQEIPVEIMVEPPPQKKPDPPPPPQPQPQPSAPTERPLDEAPAFDAPRAANKEKSEKDASDQASKAPPPPTPKPTEDPGSGAAPEGAPGPMREGELQPADHAAEPSLDKPDAEAITKAEPDHDKPKQEQANTDAKTAPRKLPSFVGQSFPSWKKGQLPTFEAIPDIELADVAKASPIGGGTAETTYNTILFGLLVAHMQISPGLRGSSTRFVGQLQFSVDGAGNLAESEIFQPSGSPELDAAAVAAVRQAAPFPTPPQGQPRGFMFTYENFSLNGDRQAK